MIYIYIPSKKTQLTIKHCIKVNRLCRNFEMKYNITRARLFQVGWTNDSVFNIAEFFATQRQYIKEKICD